ncbi:predicted protein [Nematostella vectensis]|uniref:ATP synthase F1 subunit epsilon n=1 Tax=Nematostella vectensis TaxID=45351 RepID=A7SS84_NEMVE|nr:ATPase inhibitor A, mitochondrial [Nematostella vectensis]EDO33447.1 predicted protein [Nematostella vectensis]|eukprot:XP_001625547.1 predicted protein [Nematostella vectensis]
MAAMKRVLPCVSARVLGVRSPVVSAVRMMCIGEPGSGAGKGGGSGGNIRSAGGAFGKMEQAHEEQYFRQMQAQQLAALKEHQEHLIATHKQEIEHHEEAIRRHKEALKSYEKKDGSGSDSD